MFANPIFLYALAAGAVPILVHLIFRRKRTALDYPTLMFFKRVDMKLASRRQIKEIVLLALRALAIVFVALALARPGFKGSSDSAGGASADCVIVLDNSASMGLSTPVGTRMETARTRAAAVLSSLGAEGRAAIVTTVPVDAAVPVAALTGDKALLSSALQAIAPTSGAGTLAGTIGRAQEILEQSSSAPNREIYIISDFQANLFGDDQALKTAAAAVSPRTTVFFCPVPAGAPQSNLTIAGVTTDPRPKVAGRRITLLAKVKNNSKRELTTTVSAGLRDLPTQTTTVTLQPDATQDVPIPLTLGQEGFTGGEVRLDADDAAYDNAWPFCIDVRGPIKVLVVSPNTERQAEREDSFYLRKALDPTGDGRLSGIRVTHIAEAAAPAKFEDFDTVVLCGVQALAAGPLKGLTEFIERGGGAIIFSSQRDLRLAANHPLRNLMGGSIVSVLETPRDTPPLGLRATQPAAPFFDDSRTAEGRVEFHDIAVLRALKAQADKDTAVLAEYSDGSPAILLKTLGAGRVMWWTIAPQAEDSNLPLMPSFLALLHCSVSVLSNSQAQAIERKAGQPLILDFTTGPNAAKAPLSEPGLASAVTLFDPDEKSYDLPLAAGRLTWRQTGRAGVYRLESKGAKSSAPAALQKPTGIPRGFAIVPDPEEGSADYKSSAEAKRALPVANAQVLEANADLAAAVALTRQGRELFGAFILLALLMILAEAMLANIIGARIKDSFAARTARSNAGAAGSGLGLEPAKAAPASPAVEERV